MSDKQHILNSIRTIARQLGRRPTHTEFVTRTGVSLYFVLKFFPRWNDAVRTAGLETYLLTARIPDHALLEDWGKIVRRNRKIPACRTYERQGKYGRPTMVKRFRGWLAIPQAFRHFARGKRHWADVVALLPDPKTLTSKVNAKHSANKNSPSPIVQNKVRHLQLPDRPACGNPIDFRGLLHVPVSEQGVVLLFGMVAKELGYLVESVQTGFPDCEAKRRIAPDGWQRVRIEFEFESRNFRDHGHPTNGCDIIVCWRHNWPDCPENIEIVELSSVIKSLPNSGG
jgi:hypothetical protein